MNSRERVIRAITFDHPDRIPVDSWCMKSAIYKYGHVLEDAIKKYAVDIYTPDFKNHFFSDQKREPGIYTDGWGCTWHNFKRGIIGEVKVYPLSDYSRLSTYKAPYDLLKLGWENVDSSIKANRDKFILTPWSIDIFERMQYIRGTEQLFIDLAEESIEVLKLREIVFEFYKEWLKLWLKRDVDGILFSDDWGTQNALLVSPRIFRSTFKPMYKELIDMAKAAGRFVFFHSDGNIMEIFDDFIELGVDVINCQVWCMDIYKLSEKYRGKICFWGEISRQMTLPFGTPEDVRNAANTLKKLFMHNGGGLIGNAAPGDECPLENIIESLVCWN